MNTDPGINRWRTVPREFLIWRDWDDEIVLFNHRTGNTHLLNILSGLVLKQLYYSESAISVPELAKAIGLMKTFGPLENPIEEIGVTLEELRRFGLVEPNCT